MKLSKLKINLFFLSLVLLGWFLYPKELFLGYLYEGREDISQSEVFYLSYLKRNPYSKKAVLRLAEMYERAAMPEKGLPWLERLVDHRPKDWELADKYLDYIENMHDEEKLYRARIKLSKVMLTDPRISKSRLDTTFEQIYERALWLQDYDQAYEAMLILYRVGPRKKDYLENLEALDWGLKKTKNLLTTYEQKNSEDPDDINVIEQLIGLYRILDRQKDAYALVDQSLKRLPNKVDLWMLRTYLDEDTDNQESLRSDLLQALSLVAPIESLWREIAQKLIDNYVATHEYEPALAMSRQILDNYPSNPVHWLQVLSLLINNHQWNEVLDLLGQYDQKFPDDLETLEMRLSIWLYEKKEWDHLAFYKNYLRQTHKISVARDVAYLLKQSHQDKILKGWLIDMNRVYPGDVELALLLSDVYATDKEWNLALKVVEGFSNTHTDIAFNKIYLLTNLGRRSDALLLLEELSKRKEKGLTLKIGREFLFLGQPKKAIKFLKEAVKENPKSYEAYYWLGESYYSTLQPKLAPPHHQRVVELLDKLRHRTREQNLFLFKSKGRLHGSASVATLYKAQFKKYPKDQDFQTDWLDLLLEEKKFRESTRWLSEFKTMNPEFAAKWLPYEVRLAFGLGQWKKASSLLEEILTLNPNQYAYRRDLADAYLKQGYWKKSAQELKVIVAATQDDLDVSPLIREIHERFDNQILFTFDYSKSGGENYFKEILRARQTIGQRFYLLGGTESGQFNSDFVNRDLNLSGGFLGAGLYAGEGWHFEGILQMAKTSERTILSPSFLLESPKDRDFQLSLFATLRDMADELSALVTQGDVYSGLKAGLTYLPQDRVSLGLEFVLERHDLKSGPESVVIGVTPTANYRILNKPQVQLGYEYHFEEAYDDAWVATTGYLKRVNAHYLNLSVSHDVSTSLFLEAGGFVGEDFSRDLHFYEGDLWGAHASFKWWPLDWLGISGRYEFGQETLSQLSGESHRFLLGVSGHWW